MAQISLHMKLSSPEIKGESQDQNHKDEVKLESFSCGGSNNAGFLGTSGLSSGLFKGSDAVISCYVGIQSTQVLKNCFEGTHFGEIVVSCDKVGSGNKSQTFLKFTFKNAVVSSYSVSAAPAAADQFYVETFTIAYTSMKQEYYKQDATKGTVALANSVEINLAQAATVGA